MSKFRFRMETLLRIREATRDERRAQLAEAYAAEQKLQQHKDQLLAETQELRRNYARAAMPGALNVDTLLDNHRHQLLLGAQIKQVEDQQARLAVEVERRRQVLVAADRDVRVLENLRETWKQRHRYEELSREMKQIDEVAGRVYSQSSAEGGA